MNAKAIALCVALVLGMAVPAIGQDIFTAPATVAELTFVVKDGKYYLVDFDGLKLNLVRVTFLLPPDQPKPPQPAPPVPPAPGPELSERAEIIRDTAKTVADPKRADSAAALAVAYLGVAKSIRIGQMSGQMAILTALRAATDKALPGDTGKLWQPVRTAFSNMLVSTAQEGGKDESYVKLLEEAAAGLSAVE